MNIISIVIVVDFVADTNCKKWIQIIVATYDIWNNKFNVDGLIIVIWNYITIIKVSLILTLLGIM